MNWRIGFVIVIALIATTLYAGRTYTIGTGGMEGTVLDNDTGLRWTRCSMLDGGVIDSSSDCSAGSKTYLWETAVASCENLVYAGSSNWRLPNVRELHSIVLYYKDTIPKINSTVFPGLIEEGGGSHYWSSTVSSNDSSRAWSFDFSWGSSPQRSKTSSAFVRCVTGP